MILSDFKKGLWNCIIRMGPEDFLSIVLVTMLTIAIYLFWFGIISQLKNKYFNNQSKKFFT
jgi:hypothetical protein